MLERVEGMVLRASPYGEGHRTVRILASDFSVLTAFAKGAEKQMSSLHGFTQPFSRAVFTLQMFADGTSEVRHARPEEQFARLRADPLRAAYGVAMLELAGEVARAGKPEDGANLYRIFLHGLHGLEKGSAPPRLVFGWLQAKCLRPLGVDGDFGGQLTATGRLLRDWAGSEGLPVPPYPPAAAVAAAAAAIRDYLRDRAAVFLRSWAVLDALDGRITL